MADARSGIRAAQAGLLINAALAGIKLAAGIIGNIWGVLGDGFNAILQFFDSLLART